MSYEEQTEGLVAADMAYVATATILISAITPGIALFYGTRKSYLTLAVQAYMVTGLITMLWYFFAFSLSNSTSSSPMIGNFALAALHDINYGGDGGVVPTILTFVFTDFFIICTVQIFLGAIIDRGRLLPSLVLGICFGILCYCPQSYWTWNENGWLYKLGDLDFAGGGPVHVSSGVASLAYSLFLGKRKEWKETGKYPRFEPKNPILNFLGSLLIYFPWLFFNSATIGSISTPRTAFILANTQLAAGFGTVTFTFADYLIRKKWSLQAASEGIIVGLVFVTPACGYLEPWAIAVGTIITAIVCRATYDVNQWMGIDDTTHSFNVHGIGGIMGSIFVGLFASPKITASDGVSEIQGGWIFHHWKQMGYQLAGTISIIVWTFVMTYALCFIIDKIPGLKMRVSEEAEEMGLDRFEIYEAELLEESGIEYFNGTEQQGSTGTSENIEMGDFKQPIVSQA
jgi:Amt family ammonium transporter